jgi:hypothetical protein
MMMMTFSQIGLVTPLPQSGTDLKIDKPLFKKRIPRVLHKTGSLENLQSANKAAISPKMREDAQLRMC